jgi:putative hydrolase of the HAD superfamily
MAHLKIKLDLKSFFVFDLDDTLFQEIDFLKSAYKYISAKIPVTGNANIYQEMLDKYYHKENVFEWLASSFQHLVPEMNVQWLLKEYREHLPAIVLSGASIAFLQTLKKRNISMGLITDGRSITQRNKLRALGIEGYFQDIIISEEFGSEKPDERNYLYFENKYPGMSFYFFGDNTSKDFIVPAKLGWRTICIKNSGDHIHPQSFDKNPIPDFIISGFGEIELI